MAASWRWREDVSRVRFFIASLVAPLPVAGLMIALLSPFMAETMRKGVFFVAVVVWLFGTQVLSDFVIGRFRAKVSRAGCIMIGALAGVTFSNALLTFGAILPDSIDMALGIPVLDSFQSAVREYTDPNELTPNIAMLLFGMVSGWLAWQIGARPSPEPTMLRGQYER